MALFHKNINRAKAWIERATTIEEIRKALQKIPVQSDAESVAGDFEQLKKQQFLLSNIANTCREIVLHLQEIETIKIQAQSKGIDFSSAKQRSLSEIDLVLQEIEKLRGYLKILIKKEMVLLEESRKL